MKELLRVENSIEGQDFQYEILILEDAKDSIDKELLVLRDDISELDCFIDRYTNDSDEVDNAIAACSGVLCATIDTFINGVFSIEHANEWGTEKVNEFVVKIAQNQGYSGDNLNRAVKYLEDTYPIAADKATNDFGGGNHHHLRDFSHHPTMVGMCFSMLTQFTGKVYGTDEHGVFSPVDLPDKANHLIGHNLPEKITFGMINWFFHLVSDMAGSSSSLDTGKEGTGIPGPIVSILKELSVLPLFRKLNKDGHKEVSVWIQKLFYGTLLGPHDENGKIIRPVKFDLRTEIGLLHDITKQTFPVILNECIVRCFFFLRRITTELKKIRSIRELREINIDRVLPFNNRTIIRMVTISAGTFTAIDLAEAAIASAQENDGAPDLTLLLRVNYMGVGRFVAAIKADTGMEIKKQKLIKEKAGKLSAYVFFQEAKVYYKVDQSMMLAMKAEEAINGLSRQLLETKQYYQESFIEMDQKSEDIKKNAGLFRKKNKKTVKEINRILSGYRK